MAMTTEDVKNLTTEIVKALHPQQVGAQQGRGGVGPHRNVLSVKGWDNLDVFKGGEETGRSGHGK